VLGCPLRWLLGCLRLTSHHRQLQSGLLYTSRQVACTTAPALGAKQPSTLLAVSGQQKRAHSLGVRVHIVCDCTSSPHRASKNGAPGVCGHDGSGPTPERHAV